MAKPFRVLFDPLFAKAGYQVTRLKPKEYPVEFDAQDQAIISHIAVNKLSMTSFERMYATLMACRSVCENKIAGDFVECGVWRGGNSLIAADVFKRFAPNKKIHLFDTFSGMTEPTDFDVARAGAKAKDQYAEMLREDHSEWCYASLEDVQNNFKSKDLSTQAHFIKGDVLATLTKAENIPEKISVLRLDTDWYESTKMELEVLYPQLQVGGVLIIDDYGYWGGAKKAVDEYFATRSKPFLQYTDHTGRIGVKVC